MPGTPRFLRETPEREKAPPLDALSDVLRLVRLTGAVFMDAEFTAPWCLITQLKPELCAPFMAPAPHLIFYHYVVDGGMYAKSNESELIELEAGDLVLFARNDRHVLGSDLSLRPTEVADVITPPQDCGLYSIVHGGGGAPTRLVCGFIGCEDARKNPVIAALPSAIRLKAADSGSAEWIRSTFQFAANEIAKGNPGSATVMAKLSELLFVEAVRRFVDQLPEDQTGWLAGLRDPYVAPALALLHGDISREWTVEDLSAAVGLSRSAFAERFTRMIGQAPKQYLLNWRMQVAADKLRNSNMHLAQIAIETGYESDAAFSRAFKKAYGEAPASWRRKARSDEISACADGPR